MLRTLQRICPPDLPPHLIPNGSIAQHCLTPSHPPPLNLSRTDMAGTEGLTKQVALNLTGKQSPEHFAAMSLAGCSEVNSSPPALQLCPRCKTKAAAKRTISLSLSRSISLSLSLSVSLSTGQGEAADATSRHPRVQALSLSLYLFFWVVSGRGHQGTLLVFPRACKRPPGLVVGDDEDTTLVILDRQNQGTWQIEQCTGRVQHTNVQELSIRPHRPTGRFCCYSAT